MKGYLPHSIVKAVVFWVLTLCILSVTAAAILLAWEGIRPELGHNLIKTAVVLAGGSIVFLVVNLAFGSLFNDCFDPHPSEPLDPAFSERLQRAKVASQSETGRKTEWE